MRGWTRSSARCAVAALTTALLLACAAPSLARTYYSSAAGTDPTSLDLWWTNPDSTGTHPADFASGDMFVVQSGHSLSTTGSWTISGEGSALWLQPGAVLAVGDGATHRLELTGSTFQLDDGATYVHDSAAGWDSTCFKPGITRYFGSASTVILRATPLEPGTDVMWGNLVIDLTTSPGADWSWAGNLTRVHGDLRVTNTGGHAMRLATAASPVLQVGGSLVVDGGALDLGGGEGATTVYVAGDFAMTAGWFGSTGSGVHTVVFFGGGLPRTFTSSGATLAIGNVDWSVDTETLVLASALAFPAPRTFTIASTGTLALGAALTNEGTVQVNGTLRLEAGGSVGAAPAYGAKGMLVYAGGDVTTGPEWGTTLAATPLYVTIAAGAGRRVTLGGSRTVSAGLTFESGAIATGADTLTLGPGCVVGGAGEGRCVHGHLARVVPPDTAVSLAFDVGDGATYAPVEVAFDTVRTTGRFVANTSVPGGAPAAGDPPAGSGLSQVAYVDRTWTLGNDPGAPVGFDGCAATFHFVTADVRGGGDPAGFVVARDSLGTWSQPAVGEPQTTSITATGLAGFGEFYAGEPAPVTYTLTVTTVGAGTVTREPDQPGYLPGSEVTLTATAAPGWRFALWKGDAAGEDNPLVVAMDGPKSIVATFARARLVVSQVYAGAGEAGSSYAHDFVELFNRGTQPVDVTGWTVRYAAPGDTAWSATTLAGTVPAGGYYLVREALGASGGKRLPTPDATGTTALATTGGTVALVAHADPLTGGCPGDPSIVDVVGYGDAACAEGEPADTLGATTALLRTGDGCDDTGDNALDFAVGAPAPRNSFSPAQPCTGWVDVEAVPVATLTLAPVAPNPSRGGVRVSFALPAASAVRLRVLDLQGRVVATLLDGFLPAGWHEAAWDGSSAGHAVSPGLYFVRLDACGRRAVRGFALVR